MSIAITEDHRALADTVSDFLAKHESRAAARALLEARRRGEPALLRRARRARLARAARARGVRRIGLRPPGAGRRRRGARPRPRPGRRSCRRWSPARCSPPPATDELKPRGCPAWPTAPSRRGRARRVGRAPRRHAARLGRRRARRRAGRRAARAGRRRRRGRRRARPPASPSTSRRTSIRPAAAGRGHASTARRPTSCPARASCWSTSPARSSRPRPPASPASAPSRRPSTPRQREQFGRPIAMFQAVKHHCANMLVATELATAAVWDAAAGRRRRAATSSRTPRRSRPRSRCRPPTSARNLNIQVHGGIGFTWEHDAHLYLRRASALEAIIDAETAAIATTDLDRAGASAATGRSICRPRPRRSATRCRPSSPRPKALDAAAQRDRADRDRLRHAALAQAVGSRRRRRRAAGHRAGVQRRRASSGPRYGITGWVILTLIQHATDDQVARWVPLRAAPRRSCGASCSASPTPAPTRPASRPRRPGSTAAGWSTARRSGRAAPTSPGCGLATVRTEPRRAEAQRHHDDGHRHARRGRRGAAAEDAERRLGVQRGVLQRRVRPRRRRRRPGRRRLDGRPGDARQREREHRWRFAAACRCPARR